MIKEESIWIKNILKKINLKPGSKVLDVGSSSEEHRKFKQPFIEENVFKPLKEQSVEIYHMDIKKDKGVDIVCDIENVNLDEIREYFDLVICCSLLEHVKKPLKVASILPELIKSNGYLIVSVPEVYPRHPDPVDIMFRPKMKELIAMFPNMEVKAKKTVYEKDKSKYKRIELYRYIIPFLRWKVNIVLFKKNPIRNVEYNHSKF